GDTVRWSYGAEPRMPVLNSEVNYEGILSRCHDDVQRLMFWTCVLNGACGHTYGANGIWQMNERDVAYGNSPHGGTYGPTPWQEAMALPGSGQLGAAKRLLERFAWHEFEPHPEWVHYADGAEPRDAWHHPHAAGIADKVRVIYAPEAFDLVLCEMGDRPWNATAYDPPSGVAADLGLLDTSAGTCSLKRPFAAASPGDWLVVLESA
ncbi:MAG: DUF4038 domain-containing protein, partial [Armatimonadetes bacterium]|nr:DUF4038 domain-containing protein [Armatimonadota bacterium]